MHTRELMSTPVVTVRPEASLKDLAELMIAHGVSGVPVVDRGGTLLGVVSESDVMEKIEGTIVEETETGLPRLLTVLAEALNASPKITARDLRYAIDERRIPVHSDNLR